MSQEVDLLKVQDWVAVNYLDRRFSSTDPPQIPDDKGIVKEVASVREAKHWALKIDPEVWAEESLKPGTWQNKIAFEIGISLQRLGSLVFFGAIPLGWLLHTNSDQIVDDWRLCKDWIRDYQASKKTMLVNAGIKVPFHRRHAEWIAIAAIWWMSKYCPEYYALTGGGIVLHRGPEVDEIDQFLDLTKVEKMVLHPQTRVDIEGVLGTKLDD